MEQEGEKGFEAEERQVRSSAVVPVSPVREGKSDLMPREA